MRELILAPLPLSVALAPGVCLRCGLQLRLVDDSVVALGTTGACTIVFSLSLRGLGSGPLSHLGPRRLAHAHAMIVLPSRPSVREGEEAAQLHLV